MEASNLFSAGFTLMLYGMGFVFLFLTLLIIATKAMSQLVTRYEKSAGVLPKSGVPSPTAVIPKAPAKNNALSATPATKPDILPILTAAIRAHRARQK